MEVNQKDLDIFSRQIPLIAYALLEKKSGKETEKEIKSIL